MSLPKYFFFLIIPRVDPLHEHILRITKLNCIIFGTAVQIEISSIDPRHSLRPFNSVFSCLEAIYNTALFKKQKKKKISWQQSHSQAFLLRSMPTL